MSALLRTTYKSNSYFVILNDELDSKSTAPDFCNSLHAMHQKNYYVDDKHNKKKR